MRIKITCEGNVATFEKDVKLTEHKLKAYVHLCLQSPIKDVDDIVSKFERDLKISVCVKRKNNKTVLHLTKNCFLPITTRSLQSFEHAVNQFMRLLNIWA